MMNETPLLEQIRVYSETLVEDLPDSPAVLPGQPGRPNRTRAGLLAASAAAAVVLLLVGVVPVLLSGDRNDPADEPVTTVSTPPTTPTTPAAETTQATQATETTPPAQTAEDRFRLAGFEGQLVPLTVVDADVTPSRVGDVRVIVVRSDASYAPSGLVSTSFGYGSFSWDGSHLLVSEDAVEWFAAPSPLTGSPPTRWGGSITGDQENGYTIFTEDENEATLQWHSADFIEWDLIEPPTESPPDDPWQPSEVSNQVDQLPPVPCFQNGPSACGIWFKLDPGWAWGFGPDLQSGGAELWVSTDGANWEQVNPNVRGWGALQDGWESEHIRATGWNATTDGVSFSWGGANNVGIFTATLPIDEPQNTTAAAWYWVTQLP